MRSIKLTTACCYSPPPAKKARSKDETTRTGLNQEGRFAGCEFSKYLKCIMIDPNNLRGGKAGSHIGVGKAYRCACSYEIARCSSWLGVTIGVQTSSKSRDRCDPDAALRGTGRTLRGCRVVRACAFTLGPLSALQSGFLLWRGLH